MAAPESYRPAASLPVLRLRARIRQRIRAFFATRDVWEVETPVLACSGVTDPHIDSLQSRWADGTEPVYLQTSPEYAMKRLLAADSGAIYQISRVFRYGERGRVHHPEFSLLEWYRPGYDHHRLMREVDALLRECLAGYLTLSESRFWTYRQAWQEGIGIDPFAVDVPQLRAFIAQQGIEVGELEDDLDMWQQLVMTHCVEPNLPQNTPVFIHDFPASQAALARIRQAVPPVAERFEVYLNGMELANGFHELTDAEEQRQRFERDLVKRRQLGKPPVPIDEKLLAALPHMPDCAGVALGLDRLVMLAAGVERIDEVLSFVVDE